MKQMPVLLNKKIRKISTNIRVSAPTIKAARQYAEKRDQNFTDYFEEALHEKNLVESGDFILIPKKRARG